MKIDADQVLELLSKSAASELTMYYQYTLLSSILAECEGCNIREIVEAACYKDRKHFEALVERIYQLGGMLPSEINVWGDSPAGISATLSKDMQDIQGMLQRLVETERRAVRNYTRLCNLAAGRDRATYHLALGILNEELEHRAWFSQFINDGLPGPAYDSERPIYIDNES